MTNTIEEKKICKTYSVVNTFQKCDQCGYTASDIDDMERHFRLSRNEYTPIEALAEVIINMVKQGNEKHVVDTLQENIDQLQQSTRKEEEIVICAAVKTSDGKVIRGNRHADAIHAAMTEGYKLTDLSFADQGFVTSKNRYVSREEGRELQDAAGIKSADPEGYRGKTLFSEDLY